MFVVLFVFVFVFVCWDIVDLHGVGGGQRLRCVRDRTGTETPAWAVPRGAAAKASACGGSL